MVVPYYKGLSESLKKICDKHGVQVYFKGGNTKSLLVAPKDQDPILKKSGVNNPFLNRNIGKYHLPHIWDEVLLNTSELKLK